MVVPFGVACCCFGCRLSGVGAGGCGSGVPFSSSDSFGELSVPEFSPGNPPATQGPILSFGYPLYRIKIQMCLFSGV